MSRLRVFYLWTSAEKEPSLTSVREAGQILPSLREVFYHNAALNIHRYPLRSQISDKSCPWLSAVQWSCQRGQGACSLHLLGKRILSEWRCLQISPRAQSCYHLKECRDIKTLNYISVSRIEFMSPCYELNRKYFCCTLQSDKGLFLKDQLQNFS